jgi:dimeric dUTPase (all-alpha-NTP-PPase superfamily)
MLSHMLSLQDRMNRVVNPDWAQAGYSWSRAILVEGVELLEHYNRWKWWKKNTQPDLGQCQLELVDIWHFALSLWMVRFGSADATDWVLNEAIMRRVEKARELAGTVEKSDEAFNRGVEALVGAAAQGLFDTDAFFVLCAQVDLSFEQLYAQYLGKNLLNVFRQRYGYKTGRYLKDWNGVEDNVALEQIMAQHAGLQGVELEDAVAQGLAARYTEACLSGKWVCAESDSGPVVCQVRVADGLSQLFSQKGAPVTLQYSGIPTLLALPILES